MLKFSVSTLLIQFQLPTFKLNKRVSMCGFVELGLDKKVKTAGQQAFLYVFFFGGGAIGGHTLKSV